jgi:hypothetical protein
MMKARLLNILVLCLLVSSVALALTQWAEVTPEWVRLYGQDLSVEVGRDADGLLAFTVVLTPKEPHRVMAHLAVRDSERTLATSDTPVSTGAEGNTFHFCIAPDLVATSEFTLSLWSDVPMPQLGHTDYRIHLVEFVPPELLPPPDGG